jgi:hypothetical protein
MRKVSDTKDGKRLTKEVEESRAKEHRKDESRRSSKKIKLRMRKNILPGHLYLHPVYVVESTARMEYKNAR